MKKQPVTRDYNFSDSDLYAQCLQRLQHLRRDAAEFALYAYPQERIEAFEALCNKLADEPSDDELVGEQMLATEKKNEAAEQLKSVIRQVMSRVGDKYDPRCGHYRKFGTSKINDMSDAKLLLCGRRVARVAEKLLAFLSDVGLKQTHIDQVREAAAAFETAINIQQDKISDRDIAVEDRVEISNQLYQEMIQICEIGKDVWEGRNHTKYENYTVYESNNEQKKARKKRLKEEAAAAAASEGATTAEAVSAEVKE